MIDGNIEEVLYLDCGLDLPKVAEYCGYKNNATDFVVPFRLFDEMYVKGIINDEVYQLYKENNIVEIVAI